MEIKAKHYLVTMIISTLLAVASLPYFATWGYFTIGMMLLAVVSLLSLAISIGYPPRLVHPDKVLEKEDDVKKNIINTIIMILIMIPLVFTSFTVGALLFPVPASTEIFTWGFIFCLSLAVLLIWSQAQQKP